MSVGGTTNNYEILAQIASGGMAEIFLARVTAVAGVERHVVLKRILPAFREDPQMVAMFLDEARLQAQLRHPNIAQLHDVGMIGGSYFYTMEYVHGETVQSLMFKAVSKREVIPLHHILTIAAGVTAALQHAHTRFGPDRKPLDIIHRDVSPANIMITFDGAVKLLDFGVAKSTGRMTQTRAGVVKGKVAYLSPEQIGEKGIDGRSDLFSLAICMYEMLTLHGLFARPTDLASLAAIVQEVPPPPSTLRRDIPPQIDQLIMTALAKEPLARFGNADQMHQAIEAAATSAKLSMSASSLGRYLGQMFGNRPEPWLATTITGAAPNEVPVTVIGDILEPSLARVEQVHDEAFERRAKEVDRRISQVRKVVSFDDSEVAFESNTTGKRPQIVHSDLPSAADHPQWEPTMIRGAPAPPNEFEMDAAETSIASPRYGSPPVERPSQPPRAARPSQAPAPRAARPSQAPPMTGVPPSGPNQRVSASGPTQLGPQVPSSGPQVPPSGPQVPSGPPGMAEPVRPVPPSGPRPVINPSAMPSPGMSPSGMQVPVLPYPGSSPHVPGSPMPVYAGLDPNARPGMNPSGMQMPAHGPSGMQLPAASTHGSGMQVPPSGPQAMQDPLLQSGQNPLLQSGPNRPRLPANPDQQWPVGVRPQAPGSGQGARQNWEPSTYRTRQAQPKHKQQKSWNVPRLLIVFCFLIAIGLAIWIAVT